MLIGNKNAKFNSITFLLTFVGKVDVNDVASPWTIPWPAGTQAGDLALIFFTSNNFPISPTTSPNTWNSTSTRISDSNDYSIYTGWRVLTAGDISSGTFSDYSGAGSVLVFRKATATQPGTGATGAHETGIANGSNVNMTFNTFGAELMATIGIIATRAANVSFTPAVEWVYGSATSFAGSHAYQILPNGTFPSGTLTLSSIQNASSQWTSFVQEVDG